MSLTRYVFTFGFGQPHAGGYAVVHGDSYQHCRDRMFERFGNKWSISYQDEEAAGVDRWGLRLVATIGATEAEVSA